MPRYALLRHECPPDYRDGPHWDLMLERPGVEAEHRLATWSLLQLPAAWVKALPIVGEPTKPVVGAVRATKLADHRAAYLDYEGPIRGDRGHVTRLAGGPIEWLVQSDERCEVRLLGPASVRAITLTATTEVDWLLSVISDGERTT